MRTPRRWAAGIVMILALTGGTPALPSSISEDGPGTTRPAGTLGARTLEVTGERTRDGLVHELDLTGAQGRTLTVEYRADGGPRLVTTVSTEHRAESAAATTSVALTRLWADTEYRWEAQSGGDTIIGRFRTPPLPADLGALTFRSTGSSSAPLVLLEPSRPGGFSGPVAVDGAGRVVWFHRTKGDIHGFVRRASGSFVLLDVQEGLVEITPAGDTLSTLSTSEARHIHHDVTETRDGSLLFLAREWERVAGDSIRGEAIWLWDPESGATERLWSAFDHLDYESDRSEKSRARNWLHANSLSEGPRGNLVVSFSFLDQVVSIPRGMGRGDFEWRLGGPNATHLPEAVGFSGQHTASEVAPGRVLLFDNGFDEGGAARGPSRAVEYRLDNPSSPVVWEFVPPNGNRARVVSGAVRLTSGNTLVTFGAPEGLRGSIGPTEVYEVTPAGEITWHLAVQGPIRTLYRASSLATLGGERVGPDR